MPKKSRKARKQTNLRTPLGDGARFETERRTQSTPLLEAAKPARRAARAETPRPTPKAVERAVPKASPADDTDRESSSPARARAKSNRTLYIGLVAIALAGGSFWAWRQIAATSSPSSSTNLPTKLSPPASTGGRVLAPTPVEQGIEPQPRVVTPASLPLASAIPSGAPSTSASATRRDSAQSATATPQPVVAQPPTPKPEDKPLAPKPKAPKPTAADEIY